MVVEYTAHDMKTTEEGLHWNVLQLLSVVFMSQLYAQQPSGFHHDMTTSLTPYSIIDHLCWHTTYMYLYSFNRRRSITETIWNNCCSSATQLVLQTRCNFCGGRWGKYVWCWMSSCSWQHASSLIQLNQLLNWPGTGPTQVRIYFKQHIHSVGENTSYNLPQGIVYPPLLTCYEASFCCKTSPTSSNKAHRTTNMK